MLYTSLLAASRGSFKSLACPLIQVRLNLNQLVSLESVTMIEEEAEEGSAAAGPPTTEGVASAEPSASADDVPMADGAPAPVRFTTCT